ncbi:S-layer homology domain-containing protein [Paenibacillus endoradicis]|uniref:S-layer homology domain-containing protein n=1 Tax=Paenibacillus endoradicis TaxID=2972487 RepID=UPI002158BFB0|nr:S-layer homology domain-containing protein [Paenibacillus endoradicis]MCR8658615.1 S-layer homology domain-containing protein [Paenibacillus endoradicis]
MAIQRLKLCVSFLLIVALLIPQLAFAAESPSFSLVVSKSTINTNDEFTVTVKGNNIEDLYAYDLQLNYNPALVTFKEGSGTTKLVGFTVPTTVITENSNNSLIFAHTKTGSIKGDSGSLDLVTFTFTAKANGKASFALKTMKLIDSNLVMTIVDNTLTKSIQIGSNTLPETNPGESGGAEVPDNTVVTVTADQLKKNDSSPVVVNLQPMQNQVKLPQNTAELLGSNALFITKDGAKLQISSASFKQLLDSLNATQSKDGTITLFIKSLTDLSKELQSTFGTDGQQGGQASEFKLTWTGSDKYTYDLKQFEQPITIHLTVDSSVNVKLAGIFYLPEDGKPEWIGGNYENGEFVAQVSRLGRYVVIEIDKNFSDVTKNHWANSVIKELTAKQLISGTSTTTFEPNRNITRAEFTALIVRALKLTEEGTTSFDDVADNAWYAKDISIASHAGIVQGTSAERFSPNANITREEMIVLIMRSYELMNGKTSAETSKIFSDEAQISSWAIEFVKQAEALGLVHGYSDGKFSPLNNSTRAEAAQMIYRLMKF